MYPTVERQQQADRVLGDGVRRIGRHANDGQAEAPGGRDIHVVESGAPQRDQPRATRGQRLHHGSRELVVDEHADGGKACGQGDRLFREARLEEMQVMLLLPARLPEEELVVRFRAEHRDLHSSRIAQRGCFSTAAAATWNLKPGT